MVIIVLCCSTTTKKVPTTKKTVHSLSTSFALRTKKLVKINVSSFDRSAEGSRSTRQSTRWRVELLNWAEDEWAWLDNGSGGRMEDMAAEEEICISGQFVLWPSLMLSSRLFLLPLLHLKLDFFISESRWQLSQEIPALQLMLLSLAASLKVRKLNR